MSNNLFKMFVAFLLCSCSKTEVLPSKATSDTQANNHLSEFLVFNSREDLNKASQGLLNADLRGISLEKFYQNNQLNSEFRSTSDEDTLSELVPEDGFRRLLNTQGEVQVGDSVYLISKYGTFFAHRKDLTLLRSIASSYESKNSDEMYIHLGPVTLYRTFANTNFEQEDDEDTIQEDDDRSPQSELRLYRPKYFDLDISSFPREKASRTTWAGKLLQSIGVKKSLTQKFPTNSKRRLNCAVFDYNYLIKHSSGVTAKLQKKMWYGGWAKMKYVDQDDIVVGCDYAILKIKYPPEMSEDVNRVLDKLPNNLKGNEYDQYVTSNIPTPDWFKTKLFNTTLPIISKDISVTIKDIVKLTADRVKQMMRTAAKHITAREKWLDFDDRKIEDLDREIERLKLDKFLPITTPIYAKDALYLYIKNASLANLSNRSEVTMTFSRGVLELEIGYKTGTDRFGHSLKKWEPTYDVGFNYNTLRPEVNSLGIQNANFSFKISPPDMTDFDIVEGEFFAAAYSSGSWVGYRLYW